MSAAPADDLPWPPGFAGQLARFIYESSPRPVKEVAIAAVLALLAGVCGRRFSISDTGLNLYVILVARSGIGKEAMHSGIGLLMDQGREVLSSNRFVDVDDFVSGPALHKAILMNPCFVNVSGEWGRKLRLMASDKEGPMQTLRTVMTNAYGKSGPNDSLGGLRYSSSESNLVGIRGPAFSFIGETTPDTFYKALTSSMMEDGFLSRFIIIHYPGERPPPNEARACELEPDELQHWKGILSYAVPAQMPINAGARVDVDYLNDDAREKLAAFGRHCDDQVNATLDEGRRQMWNRAHIKALRVAALLAVADNEVEPRIDLGHATWAKTLVSRDIAAMSARMDSGDVGSDDHTRIDLVRAAIKDYFLKDHTGSYNVMPGMREAGVLTYTFIQTRMRQKPAFKDYPQGSVKALDITLKSMCDSGTLMELYAKQVEETYAYSGRCFRLQSLA